MMKKSDLKIVYTQIKYNRSNKTIYSNEPKFLVESNTTFLYQPKFNLINKNICFIQPNCYETNNLFLSETTSLVQLKILLGLIAIKIYG